MSELPLPIDLCITFCSPDSGSHDLQDGSHDASSEEETVEVTSGRHDNQWDCESVLSTYSNLYNHPVTISDPVGVCVRACVCVEWCVLIRTYFCLTRESVLCGCWYSRQLVVVKTLNCLVNIRQTPSMFD